MVADPHAQVGQVLRRQSASGQTASRVGGVGETLLEHVAAIVSERDTQVLEPLLESNQGVGDRLAVLEQDVGPDRGVTRGDARHVAKSSRRELQQDRVLLSDLGRFVHQSAGE